MQDRQLFEYAVIRVVPRVEREEFLNVGVVLYCGRKKFLGVRFLIDEQRIGCAFGDQADINEINDYLRAFERICAGAPGSGPIGKLPVAERFRWLTATRSTVVQVSKVHPGFCDDAAERLEQLFAQLVM